MTGSVAGDPASCSRLGGDLRSQAVRLLAVRAELELALTPATRDGAGERAPQQVERARRAARLLDSVIEQLDRNGAVLQQYAQDLAQVEEAARELEGAVQAAGLELEGLRVVEPWGVSAADTAARRQAAQPTLQNRADRLTSRLGRSRGAVRRAMTHGTQLLQEAAESARGSLGS